MRIYMLLGKTRFRALVGTSDHNNRMIPIVFSRLVLTKSWKRSNWEAGRFYGMLLIYFLFLSTSNTNTM